MRQFYFIPLPWITTDVPNTAPDFENGVARGYPCERLNQTRRWPPSDSGAAFVDEFVQPWNAIVASSDAFTERSLLHDYSQDLDCS
jgi:hypothetical protein